MILKQFLRFSELSSGKKEITVQNLITKLKYNYNN